MLIFRVGIMYIFYNDIQWADMTIYNSDMLSAVRIYFIPHKTYSVIVHFELQ